MNAGEPNPLSLTEQKRFPWRLFWLLALLVLFASLLLIPYALQLAKIGKPELANQAAVMRISATVGSVIQAILIYWPMTLLGLIFARRLDLGAPYLEALVGEHPPQPTWTRILIPSAWIGFGGGLLVLILSAVVGAFAPAELAQLNSTASSQSLPNAWQGFLGAISAGINEETLLRLFLLSFLAWSIQWLFTRRTAGRPTPAVLWAANLLAAIVFGLLHITNLSAMNVSITPYLVLYLVALNGLAGLGFGWLFWTFGLESAMLAHFFMDIVLHVLTVPLQGLVR